MALPDIKVSVDAVVFAKQDDGLYILLIQRKNEPFQDMWALPGGFVEVNEDLPVAAMRELEEETGLKCKGMQQLSAYGKPGRDPRFRTVTVAYYTPQPLATKAEVAGADDASDARWYHTEHLPDIAFDHAQVIQDALQRVS